MFGLGKPPPAAARRPANRRAVHLPPALSPGTTRRISPLRAVLRSYRQDRLPMRISLDGPLTRVRRAGFCGLSLDHARAARRSCRVGRPLEHLRIAYERSEATVARTAGTTSPAKTSTCRT